MSESGMHERLRTAVGERSYRLIGELTGTGHESVRRYMQGHPPSAEFLVAVCRAMGINAHWLLTGQGPMRLEQLGAEALRRAEPGLLFSEMATRIEDLIERVGRLEETIQSMETRLLAGRAVAVRSGNQGSPDEGGDLEAGGATDASTSPLG